MSMNADQLAIYFRLLGMVARKRRWKHLDVIRKDAEMSVIEDGYDPPTDGEKRLDVLYLAMAEKVPPPFPEENLLEAYAEWIDEHLA